MTRVKRGTIANKKRKNVLKQTKGFRWGRKSKYILAKQASLKAGVYAWRDRKVKKREFRKFWQTKINAASRKSGLSYSKLIAGLKKNKIELDRKILSQLAENYPQIFKEIAERAKS